MTRLEALVSETRAKLRPREEEREVIVELRADFGAGVAREVRLDTEAVLLERELLPTERQRPLFDPSMAANGHEPAAPAKGAAVEPYRPIPHRSRSASPSASR